MTDIAGARIRAQFPEFVLDSHQDHGDDTVVLTPEGLVPVLAFLRDDPDLAFDLPLDVTCVDLLGLAPKPIDRTAPLHPMYHTQSVPPRHLWLARRSGEVVRVVGEGMHTHEAAASVIRLRTAAGAANARMLPSAVTTNSFSSAASILVGVPWISARQTDFGG